MGQASHSQCPQRNSGEARQHDLQSRRTYPKIDNRLQTFSSARISGGATDERKRFQDEKESIEQCLAVCTQASEQANKVRTNAFEDVSAAKDAHQLIVATLGDFISAKRVTAESGATQWLGQMSDAALQQLSRDRGIELRDRAATDKVGEPKRESIARFAVQYGAGHILD